MEKKVWTTIILAVISILILSSPASAQEGEQGNLFNRELNLIEFTSPNEWSFFKYVDNPVGLYHGNPDVSIPLYTIKDGSVEIPIVLRYNTSGIRVEEEAGWAGLGWNLNLGGYIVCQIVDGDDYRDDTFESSFENMFYDSSQGNVNTHGSIGFTYDMFQNFPGCGFYADDYHWGKLAPDVYFFSYPGNEGRYVIDPRDSAACILQRESDLAIENDEEPASGSSAGKRIITPEGISHYFDYSGNKTLRISQIVLSRTFTLSRSVYPNGDTVTYSYAKHNYSKEEISAYEAGSLLPNDTSNPNDYLARSGPLHDHTFIDGTESDLSSITTPNYIVEFSVSDRLDRDTAKKLDAIIIRDRASGTIIKRFAFSYGYFNKTSASAEKNVDSYRLMLSSVKEVSVSDTTKYIDRYTFGYNTQTALPSKKSYSSDYWGYPNAQTDVLRGSWMPDLKKLYWNKVHTDDYGRICFFDTPCYDKSHDYRYCQAGLLTSITYPTGGRTEFTYESNSFTGLYIPSKNESGQGAISTSILDQNHAGDVSSTSITIGGRREFNVDYVLSRGNNSWNDISDSFLRIPYSTHGTYPDTLVNFGPPCLAMESIGSTSSSISGSVREKRESGTHAFQAIFPDALGDQYGPSLNHGSLAANIWYYDANPDGASNAE